MTKQTGQIAILIPIIIFLVAIFTIAIPKTSNNSNLTSTCMIGEDPIERYLTLPAINNFSEGNGHDDSFGEIGGPDLNNNKEYKLVRAKVPVDRIDRAYNNPLFPRDGNITEHFVKYNNKVIDGVTYEVYYPNKYGESTLDGEFQWKYSSPNNRDLQFHQEGFIFFVRLKPNFSSLNFNDQPETTTGIDRVTKNQALFYLVDLYQEKTRYEASLTGARGYTYDDVFKCQTGSQMTQKMEYPSIAPGKDTNGSQMQVRNFIVKTSNNYGFSSHCKPAIYLYPTEKTEVNVKVDTKGILTYTDPLYPSAGWDVTAYPDGKILSKNKDYEYLYYESKIPDNLIEKPKEGFVVQHQDLSKLFSSLLPKLGLSVKQTLDFKTYWEKVLPNSPYYFVGVLSEKNINNFEPLIISPKPSTIIRVRLYFEALNKKIEVKEPEIITPGKNGFTVIEWGGMIKTDKEHPFTCSQ